MYKYNVTLDVAKEINTPYSKHPVTFLSPVLLSDRDIRRQAINRTPEEYISFGWFTKIVEEEV